MKFKLKIGEKEYEIEVLETERGTKVKVNEKEFLFEEKEELKEIFKAKVNLPKRDFGEKKILAPIAGEVVEVFVKEGDLVKEGEKLLLLSAMKMENEISSEIEGRVKKVLVQKGEKVKKDQILLVLE